MARQITEKDHMYGRRYLIKADAPKKTSRPETFPRPACVIPRPKTTAAATATTIAEPANQQKHCSTITAAINETVTRACFAAQNANRTMGRHIRPILCMEGKVKIAIPKIPYGSIPALRFFFKI